MPQHQAPRPAFSFLNTHISKQCEGKVMTLLRGHMFLQLLQSLKNPPDSEGDSAYPMVEVRIDQQFVSMCEGFFCNQKVYNGNDIFLVLHVVL